MIDSNYETNIKKTKEAIPYIVDTVKLCRHHNIPLWGHSDGGKNQQDLGEGGITNTENVIELLNCRLRVGMDKPLCLPSKMPSTSPRNSKFFSNMLHCKNSIVKNL